MNNWYFMFNGQQVGPMSEQQLISYGLKPDSYVWRQGMNEWAQAGSLPELASYFSCAQPGVPPHYGGNGYQQPNAYAPNGYPTAPNSEAKSKVATGLLAIFLGYLGIQYFYIGKTGAGFITILLTIVTCGAWDIICLIQGIVMLTMSDEEFNRKFVYTNKTFPIF